MLEKRQDICDIVSILVYCQSDETFLVTQDKNSQEIWIPGAKVGDKSWSETAKNVFEDLRLNGNIKKICHLTRVWKPPKSVIHHVVFLAKVTVEHKPAYGFYGFKTFWTTVRELKSAYTFLKSPEILDYISCAIGMPFYHPQQLPETIWVETLSLWSSLIDEVPMSDITEILEDHALLRDESIHKRTMDSVGFTDAVQGSIFYYYLTMCFPSTFMTQRTFITICEKLGLDRNLSSRMFVTADIETRGFLSYRDFLYIIAVIDPNMKHGVLGTEIRSRYIFHHYDIDKNRLLELHEAKAILQDLRNTKIRNADAVVLAKDIDACARALGIEPRQPTDAERFVKALTNPKAKGTTVLLRAFRSLVNVIPKMDDNVKSDFPAQIPRIPAPLSINFQTKKDVPEYSVAVHYVRLRKNGTAIEKIWDGDKILSDTSLTQSKTVLKNSPSLDSFNPVNVHCEVLRGLEYFEKEVSVKEAHSKPGKKPKPAFNWGMVDPSGFGKCVIKVSNGVADVLKSEQRLLELSSPVYVLGDLHGNFQDLLRFQKALWPLGPSLSPSTLLVLGDYVDRGPHCIELISHLFAYKLQCPKKVKLLRGNHEIRAVQRMFTFYQECIHKFGQKLGVEVWEAVNKAMDCLPLSAIIDGKVFCAHGGIPPPWLCPTVATINTIPCPLSRPDEQSPLAWDIMWNDPLDTDDNGINLELELSANEGFANNTRRGTGHYFSSDALNTFLTTNNLSILLRAHQMHDRGFYVQMNHRMETVFSASNYGTAKNESGCILVDCGRLRAFRMEVPA